MGLRPENFPEIKYTCFLKLKTYQFLLQMGLFWSEKARIFNDFQRLLILKVFITHMELAKNLNKIVRVIYTSERIFSKSSVCLCQNLFYFYQCHW